MKIILISTAILATTASAFTTTPSFSSPFIIISQQQQQRRTYDVTTTLFNSRVDSSEAIQAALEASKKYGPTSKEARVAWDIVEEMDASDNSNAYKGSTTPSPEDQKEYNDKLSQLSTLLSAQKEKITQIQSLAHEIQAVKLAKPTITSSADSPAMRDALAEAKEASEKFGSESKEAALAWEALEEVASADYGEATKGSLDDECLVETIDACEAMAELERAINVAASQDQGRYSG